MSSESYHEPYESLSEKTRDMHRAVVSLMEELEAIDWYQQRADGCTDEDLRAILLHNKDEEIEHAMMVLEWLRRHDGAFDAQARTYLYTEGPITEIEETMEGDALSDGASSSPPANHGSLGIGSLK